MAAPERFSILAAIEPLAGWHRALALDRAGDGPRAVVLSFVPAAITEDSTRMVSVMRDAEVAARLQQPAAVPVLGMETVRDALAIVEPYRPGTTLKALLASGGRLPPDIAGRILADACAAIEHAHGLEAGDGLPLVHGVLDPGRISVGRDGGVEVSGFGTGGFASAADDVLALGAILHECLAGEPPADPPVALDMPGVSRALAGAVARAIGSSHEGAFESAVALREAITAAVPVASRDEVASYAEAILPAEQGRRAELFATLEGLRPAPREDAEEISEDLIVEQSGTAGQSSTRSTAAAALPAAPAIFTEPLASSRPAPDAATTFPAPARLPPVRSFALPAIVVVCAVSGFAIGLAASRLVTRAPPSAVSAVPPEDGSVPLPPPPEGFILVPAKSPPEKRSSHRASSVRKAAKVVRRTAGSRKGTVAVPRKRTGAVPPKSTVERSPQDTVSGSPKEYVEGSPKDVSAGSPKNSVEGSPNDAPGGTPKGTAEGSPKDASDGSPGGPP